MNKLFLNKTLLIICAVLFSCCHKDKVAPKKSVEKNISSFKISGIEGVIDPVKKTIQITLPAGTDPSALKPIIEISAKATVNPASGTAQDFSKEKGVLYKVTAEDGSTQNYTVTVKVLKAQEDPAPPAGQPAQPVVVPAPKPLPVTDPTPAVPAPLPVTSPTKPIVPQPAPPVVIPSTKPVVTQPVISPPLAPAPSIEEGFTLEPYTGSTRLEVGSDFIIKGQGFGTDPAKVEIYLISITSEKYPVRVKDVTNNSIKINISEATDIPLYSIVHGGYEVKIRIGSIEKSLSISEPIQIVAKDAPFITKLSIKDHLLVINGKNFGFDSKVHALCSGVHNLSIESQSPTEITIEAGSIPCTDVIIFIDDNSGYRYKISNQVQFKLSYR